MLNIHQSKEYKVSVPNRESLVDLVYNIVDQIKFNNFVDNIDNMNESFDNVGVNVGDKETFMSVKCECGKIYDYEEEWDIPYDDVDCSCGVHIITYNNPMLGV